MGIGEAESEVRHKTLSLADTSQLSIIVDSCSRNKIGEESIYLRLDVNLGDMSSLNYGQLHRVMASSPGVKGEPGTHDSVSIWVNESPSCVPHRLANPMLTTGGGEAQVGCHGLPEDRS